MAYLFPIDSVNPVFSRFSLGDTTGSHQAKEISATHVSGNSAHENVQFEKKLQYLISWMSSFSL